MTGSGIGKVKGVSFLLTVKADAPAQPQQAGVIASAESSGQRVCVPWPASAPFVKQHAALAFLECDLIGVLGACALLRSAQADVDVVDVNGMLETPKELPLAHLEHQPLGVAATCFAVGAAHKFLTRAGEEHERHGRQVARRAQRHANVPSSRNKSSMRASKQPPIVLHVRFAIGDACGGGGVAFLLEAGVGGGPPPSRRRPCL